MNSKINCTCGWSWNKSDSSKKDMYICHECGKNNKIKNGGWLDKYQNGGEILNAQKGKKVKYVDSKNDPRYITYQDSLNSYNTGNKVLNKLKTILENNQKDISGYGNGNNNYSYATTDYIKNPYKKPEYGSNKKGTSPKGQGKDLEKWIKKELDFVNWKSQLPIAEALKELDKNNVLPFRSISSAEIPTISIYKKPEEEVIVQRLQEQLIEKNLQPIDIQNDFNLEAPLPQIKQQVKQPKYYDVEDYTHGSTNYNGGQSNYKIDNLSELPQQSNNNTRKVVPHYKNGGELFQAQQGTIIQKDLTDLQVNQVNNLTGMNFEPEFAQKYFMTEEESRLKDAQKQQQIANAALQHTNKITDITSESPGAFSNKRIWHDKRPEQYVNKEELVEGKQYTTIPYSQWADYQKSPQYMKYKNIPPTNTVASMQEGGIIKDDNGYWNPSNWGKDVEIDQSNPDSFIDMEGVYEPLLGVSKETGEKKIMYPGEKHKFGKGTKKVIESPLAKNGIRQEQKGLQNLDNLVNFTNYNKPQPGGWLNKYES